MFEELTVTEEEYRGYTVRVILDTDCQESPRDWDNLGTMICKHSRYDLGDVQIKEDTPEEYFNNTFDILEPEGYDLSDKENERIHKWIDKNLVILPLYLYDHSGITMSTNPFNCPWDSGQVGFIYVSNKDILKEWSKKRMSKKLREKAFKCLVAEVTVYDQYLTGQVYGYVVGNKEDEHLESCWGFYGEEDYCLSEGKAVVDCIVEKKIKDHITKVKNWIKNKVPLEYRTSLQLV